MYDKEEIYDEKIAPLMKEVIKVCKEEGINFLAHFYLAEETEEENHLHCTTYIPGEKEHDKLKDALKLVRGKGYFTPHFTMTTVIKNET